MYVQSPNNSSILSYSPSLTNFHKKSQLCVITDCLCQLSIGSIRATNLSNQKTFLRQMVWTILMSDNLQWKENTQQLRNVIQAYPVLQTFLHFSVSYALIRFLSTTSSNVSSLQSDLTPFSTSTVLSSMSLFVLSSTALVM